METGNNKSIKTLKDYPYFNKKGLLEQIKKSKSEYNVVAENRYCEDDHVSGVWIPFNLERKYVDILIEEKRYKEANDVLKEMRASYGNVEFHNFIEQYEYRLISIIHLDQEIKNQIIKAKESFNKHTVTLITVIVGLVTIFGAANNFLRATTFKEGLITFLSISAILLLTIGITLCIVNKDSKN